MHVPPACAWLTNGLSLEQQQFGCWGLAQRKNLRRGMPAALGHSEQHRAVFRMDIISGIKAYKGRSRASSEVI